MPTALLRMERFCDYRIFVITHRYYVTIYGSLITCSYVRGTCNYAGAVKNAIRVHVAMATYDTVQSTFNFPHAWFFIRVRG